MLKNKQSLNWLLDAGLLAGFLAAFFLDLTGVELHQWLGLGLGALAGYHLVTHWSWVKSVTKNLFSRASARARDYYLIDASLLAGFFLILVTGLLISTWLDLEQGSYVFWKDAHLVSSIATLLIVVVKIGLHWRWIVSTAMRTFRTPFGSAERVGAPSGQAPTQPLIRQGQLAARSISAAARAQPALSRRHFLALMGVVGMSAWMAINSSLFGEKEVQAEALSDETSESNLAAGSAASQAARSSSNSGAGSASAAAASAGSASSASGSLSGGSCRVQCSKRCSFPGKCRKYVDRNSNKKCDLGECA